MKKLLLTAALITLSACASNQSAYGPMNNGYGYRAAQYEADRFRVTFTGRSAEEAQDYALLRAAEITRDEGYSHFKVLESELYGNDGTRSRPSTSIGVGIGNGGYGRRSGTDVRVGIGVHDVARALEGSKITNSIEIRLKQSGGSDDRIYNARTLIESIQPELYPAE